MTRRLTSDIFVSALIRNTEAVGGNAYVTRRGSAEAGAIFIAVYRASSGQYDLYQPSMQSDRDETSEALGGRSFQLRETLSTSLDLCDFQTREERFDSDFWLVELERIPDNTSALFTVIDE